MGASERCVSGVYMWKTEQERGNLGGDGVNWSGVIGSTLAMEDKVGEMDVLEQVFNTFLSVGFTGS